MTISGLYIQNGNSAGFWIQHRSWRNECAQVVSIAGQSRGSLPEEAATHAAGVLVRCFDVRSGRPIPRMTSIDQPDDRGFVRIAVPPWIVRDDHPVSGSVV